MIPLQWVTATWFMWVCMFMGAPIHVVLIMGAVAYLLSPRYKTTETENTTMTPEQKRIEELERQLAMQREAMDAIGDAVVAIHGAIQFDTSVDNYVERMVEKLDDLKENTL